MKVNILHVLCEGHTEMKFAQHVLKPYLSDWGIVVKAAIVTTNDKLGQQGGILNFAHIERDIRTLLSATEQESYAHHLVTTMVDLYALPTSFPGMADDQGQAPLYDRVAKLERAWAQTIDHPRFLPYLQVHEFEALLFCGIPYLAEYFPICSHLERDLNAVLSRYENPEHIDGGRHTAPCKRIAGLVEGQRKYKYNKPRVAEYVTSRVGIDRLRECCPHFNQWMERLLNWAQHQE